MDDELGSYTVLFTDFNRFGRQAFAKLVLQGLLRVLPWLMQVFGALHREYLRRVLRHLTAALGQSGQVDSLVLTLLGDRQWGLRRMSSVFRYLVVGGLQVPPHQLHI